MSFGISARPLTLRSIFKKDYEKLRNRKICLGVFRVSTLPWRKCISSIGLRGWEDDIKYGHVSQNVPETAVFKKFSPLLVSWQAA